MIFISEVDSVSIYNKNESVNNLNQLTNQVNFIPKTTTILGVSKIDETQRKSLVHKDKFKINLNLNNLPYGIKLNQEWELLLYNEKGFFNKHRDRQLNQNHKYTALLYPKSTHKGGELILEDEFSTTIIESSKMLNWTLVIFPINLQHESLPVKSGIKYLFKSSIFIDEKVILEDKNDQDQLYD